jgi:outer membrane biosynthesis protein TonB
VAITSRLIVPLGIAISCIAHLAFLTPAVLLGNANPFDRPPEEQAISVEIMSEDEAPKPPAEPQTKIEPPPAPAKPADTKPVETKPTETAAPPQPEPRPMREARPQPAPAAPAPAPAVAPSSPADVFGLPLTLPDGMIGYEYQTPAIEKADLAKDVVAAFRRHLKTCLTLPAGVTVRMMTAGAKATLQINLNPDGTLVKGPENPHGVGQVYYQTTGGGDIYNAAKAAVLKCQPYTMLPADRYDEWRTLNLTFTPQDFSGE